MISRIASRQLKSLAKGFKAVVVTGPRQSGKTTLVRSVFPSKQYVLLEDPDVRQFAETDPRGFLAQFKEGAILDEVQRVPNLFSYLQGILDKCSKTGQYILTGSYNLALMSSVTQSLAGRVGILELFPFSMAEIEKGGWLPDSVDMLLYKGGYPAVYDQKPEVKSWYNSYITTYVERDVRQLINIKDVSQFQQFLGLCAGNIGQLFNSVRLGNDCGVHHNTVKSWLSILETSYLIFRLQPHSVNFRKRLVKTPKVYFCDTGLALRLLGIENEKQLRTHPLRGQLFENWAVSELLKSRLNRGNRSNLYFWRNHRGMEIDVIADHGQKLIPIEIKSGATVSADWIDSLEKWAELAGKQSEKPWIVYGGDRIENRSNLTIIPWKEIGQLIKRV